MGTFNRGNLYNVFVSSMMNNCNNINWKMCSNYILYKHRYKNELKSTDKYTLYPNPETSNSVNYNKDYNI